MGEVVYPGVSGTPGVVWAKSLDSARFGGSFVGSPAIVGVEVPPLNLGRFWRWQLATRMVNGR